MWYLRRVVGNSMKPAYRRGQVVLIGHARQFRINDVVVAFVDRREVLKRITDIKDGKVYLLGDNAETSTDSRTYGWVQDRHIVGKVVWPKKRQRML